MFRELMYLLYCAVEWCCEIKHPRDLCTRIYKIISYLSGQSRSRYGWITARTATIRSENDGQSGPSELQFRDASYFSLFLRGTSISVTFDAKRSTRIFQISGSWFMEAHGETITRSLVTNTAFLVPPRRRAKIHIMS